MSKILIVDDENVILELLQTILTREGHEIKTVETGPDALLELKQQSYDLMVTDIQMTPMNGLELLKVAKDLHPQLAVIVMTAYASVETAVEAMQNGAYDYITKPFKVEDFLAKINRAIEFQNIIQENKELKSALRDKYHFTNLIGDSDAILPIYKTIEKISQTDIAILIRGESGTGKEVVSKAIHYASKRSDKPFIAINCAALPENLLESELFGHVEGAFDGANSDKEGLFQAANGGTIFLDEIGSISSSTQGKILRILQEKVLHKIGSNSSTPINTRIIAATTEDLENRIKEGTFREDFYFRLSVIPINLPALRQRTDDIPLLVQHFIHKFEEDHGSSVEITPEAMKKLSIFKWPGNIRQLENCIYRSAALCDNQIVTVSDLPDDIRLSTSNADRTSFEDPDLYRGHSLKKYLRLKEKEYIGKILEKVDGNKEEAAEYLGVSLATFYRKYTEEL